MFGWFLMDFMIVLGVSWWILVMATTHKSPWSYKQVHRDRYTRMSAHHLRDLQCKRASRSMHSQVYVFMFFFGMVFGVFSRSFFSLLGMSKTFLDPNMVPSWGPRWPQNRSKVVFRTLDVAKVRVFKFPLFYNTFGASGGSQDVSKSC